MNTDTFFCKAGEGYSYLADYVLSKRLFFELAARFAETRGCTLVNLRLEHVYGPGDGPGKFVAVVIRKLLDNVPEIELTPGEQYRDFVYVGDVVDAYVKLANSMDAFGDQRVWRFEVGTGSATSIKEFVTTAHAVIGSKSKLAFGAFPYRENEIMCSKADVRALSSFGWRSGVDLKTGIAEVVSSIRGENADG
jgi:nucleoside-diphosphate-sugar epimerase